MSSTLSERRMAENEMVFRSHNERVEKGFENLKVMAKEDGQEDLVQFGDIDLQFYCECSDENCRKRVNIKLSQYSKIHKNRSNFVIVPGHSVRRIERIVQKRPSYWVLEKFIDLPKKADGLNSTNVDNV
jgi:hypothetical protein